MDHGSTRAAHGAPRPPRCTIEKPKAGVGIDLTQCLSCAKCGRAVQVRTIEGVAENQKSESPGSYPSCGRTVLRPLRVLTRSPKLGGAFGAVSLAPPECVGMR